jgi:ABC-type glycerol-3-phosphate transport system permease component
MKKVSLGRMLNYLIITLIGFITLYPFIYILSVSITPPTALLSGRVVFLPKGFDLSAYQLVLTNKNLVSGFINTVMYSVAGTALSIFLTTLTAYPLAQPHFKRYAKVYMRFVVFTMLFSGGLIPTYLVIRGLRMVNTFWVMIVPGAVSAFYLILVRTFMQQLPQELYEAAVMEGCGDFNMYIRIVIPLCTPIIACIALYYAVGIWNSYMTPLIYITSESKYPLQIFLRQIILMASVQEMEMAARGTETLIVGATFNSETLKAATLVVSTIPILVVYPFLQKYFVKGIMVGAIKG